ncbi:MAG: UbiA family prenyltransferase [Limisphaerales bacterium]
MSPEWVVWRKRLRPWLILGRVSNLPTVWSNCLAAWLLGGGGSPGRLMLALLGGSLIYVAGMFLNDACDVEFDRVHRGERPIPSGEVTVPQVWVAGLGLLLAGWICLVLLGTAGMILGVLLLMAVMAYDFVHKSVSFSPVLMAACRFFLFLAAGSAAAEGIVGRTVWSGLVLALYIVGLSYVARCESAGGLKAAWPFLLLGAPIALAGFVNAPSSWRNGTVLMPVVLLVIWTLRCQTLIFRASRGAPSAGGGEGVRAGVSGLLAGIVWVDVVAVMPAAWPMGGVFLGLFVLSLVLQRVVPAT